MKIETLNNKKRKVYLFGLLMGVVLLFTVLFTSSFAKYRNTESINIVKGVIKYKPYDIGLMAIKQADTNGEYQNVDVIPTSGYYLNNELSYCEVNGVKDSNVELIYENGKIYVGMTSKGTKCYLYFDEIVIPEATITVLASDLGSNNWYKSLSFNVAGRTTDNITNINYCIANTNCTPNTTVNASSTVIALNSSASAQKVCANVSNGKGTSEVVCSNSYLVDGIVPTITVSSTSTYNSITLNVTGVDEHSKIAKYYYKIGTNNYIESTATTYTFKNLNFNVTYNVEVYAIDNAGNMSQVTTLSVLTTCLTEDMELLYLDKKRKKKRRKKIKDIKKGDLIYMLDEVSGKEVERKVTDIYLSKVNLIFKLTLENGEIIKCSSKHAFVVNGMGTMLVDELKIGYKLESVNEKVYEIINIEILNYKDGIDVYNLSFDDNKNKTYMITGAMILTFAIINNTTSESINKVEHYQAERYLLASGT